MGATRHKILSSPMASLCYRWRVDNRFPLHKLHNPSPPPQPNIDVASVHIVIGCFHPNEPGNQAPFLTGFPVIAWSLEFEESGRDPLNQNPLMRASDTTPHRAASRLALARTISPKEYATLILLIIISSAAGISYFSWWWYAPIGGSKFLMAASLAFQFAQVFILWGIWLKARVRPDTTPAPSITVDVFVVAYKEPVELIEKTLRAAVEMRHPHSIFLLDDGPRPGLAELAHRAGTGYIARRGNKDAKAGNINHALGKTDGEIVVIFRRRISKVILHSTAQMVPRCVRGAVFAVRCWSDKKVHCWRAASLTLGTWPIYVLAGLAAIARFPLPHMPTPKRRLSGTH